MRDLDYDVLFEKDGILINTIRDLFDCNEFMYQRRNCFLSFFKKCMTDPDSSNEIIRLLLSLCRAYLELYNSNVSKTYGNLEKQLKLGKFMTNNFEAGRDKLIADYRVKFSRLGSIQKHIVFEDTEPFTNIYEESNLLFAFLEKILCLNFWSWFHKEKGIHVDDFIKERPLTDTSYQYSRVMLDKIYDITGYLCGHRIFNLLSLNRIKRDYRNVFEEFYLHSRYPNGTMALSDKLPAEYLLFRQHSEGLYFAKKGNFEFVKVIQAIYMQSLTTDVLILFNSFEPVKRVEQVILNSKSVQSAFKTSCFMHTDLFTTELDLVLDKCPIAYLYRFLIQGFIRVYSKDIYQLRLSNVLLSKTGASGIRTALLTLSAISENKKNASLNKVSNKITALPQINLHIEESPIIDFVCPCGKRYISRKKGWYLRHLVTCSVYISINAPNETPSTSDQNENDFLDNMIELECSEELDDYSYDVDQQVGIDQELDLENSENDFDSNFIAEIIVEESEDN